MVEVIEGARGAGTVLRTRAADEPRAEPASPETGFGGPLGAEVVRAHARAEPLAVVVLELDDFELLEVRVGAAAGDTVLADLEARVAEHVERRGTSARVGRNEFAAALREASANEGESLVLALQASLAGWPPADAGQLRISAGITDLTPRDTLDSVLDRARHALWQAKQTGTEPSSSPTWRATGPPEGLAPRTRVAASSFPSTVRRGTPFGGNPRWRPDERAKEGVSRRCGCSRSHSGCAGARPRRRRGRRPARRGPSSTGEENQELVQAVGEMRVKMDELAVELSHALDRAERESRRNRLFGELGGSIDLEELMDRVLDAAMEIPGFAAAMMVVEQPDGAPPSSRAA